MNKERITYLIKKYSKAELTETEKAELILLLKTDSEGTLIRNSLVDMMEVAQPADDLDQDYLEKMAKQLMEVDKVGNTIARAPVRHIGFQRRWIWAAASIIIMLAVGTYGWLQFRKMSSNKLLVNAYRSVAVSPDVAPGKQGAILKLGDGTKVLLDSLGNGVVAIQNGVQVVLKNGQLAYDPTGKASGKIVYNTMYTPRGRQFRLTLPDGSQVWLNAASSITYPTIFAGTERQVSINGEAYFEVARNVKMPFKIRINNQTTVEVLGTHFNIKAYPDEANIQTTLLEGSVKMRKDKKTAMLLPGQQACVSNSPSGDAGIKVEKDADIEKIMAWKNGLFNFQGANLEEVMRQLSRWYEIEVVYEKEIPDLVFVGEMSKDISLSGVLKGLQGAGVHFRIEEGRRLVVFP
jgi:transmembrane sensor